MNMITVIIDVLVVILTKIIDVIVISLEDYCDYINERLL